MFFKYSYVCLFHAITNGQHDQSFHLGSILLFALVIRYITYKSITMPLFEFCNKTWFEMLYYVKNKIKNEILSYKIFLMTKGNVFENIWLKCSISQ